jgi:hypothetical protein
MLRQANEELVTLAEAARLWKVSRATANRWNQLGALTCFRRERGTTLAPVLAMRALKVLSELELLPHGITREVVRTAVGSGIAVAADSGRFSLDDVEELQSLAAAGHLSAPRPPQRISGVHFAPFRWGNKEVEVWVEAGADPGTLPDAFWVLPCVPRFIPPADVFLYEFGKRLRGGIQLVRRSEGYARERDTLVWHSEKDDCTRNGVRLRVGESMPRAWAESSHRYRMANEQWVREWYRRRPVNVGG